LKRLISLVANACGTLRLREKMMEKIKEKVKKWIAYIIQNFGSPK
jgi:hypothetical protein